MAAEKDPTTDATMGGDVEAVKAEARALIEEYRTWCLWHAPRDWQPRSLDDYLWALRQIAGHGDRQAFIRSRKLQRCLLRSFSEDSAER